MNKQILHLFNEAGFHQPEMERLCLDQKFEKFARLIVNECLDELCNQMDAHDINLANLPAWYKALEKTEQHFGIKE